MVDMVVHRHQLRETVSRIVRLLMKAPPDARPPPEEERATAEQWRTRPLLVPVESA